MFVWIVVDQRCIHTVTAFACHVLFSVYLALSQEIHSTISNAFNANLLTSSILKATAQKIAEHQ